MLLPRQENRDRYWNDDRHGWDWGRWVLLAGLLTIIMLFFLMSCVSARRRRRAGLVPFRGTGWLYTGPPPGHGPAMYTGPQTYYSPPAGYPPPGPGPAPPYSPPMNATGQPGGGYYGQQTGIELQPPQNVYQSQQPAEPVYAPPAGPPPSHMK